ncbi:ABC transporter permease [Methylobacterium oryzae]|uniref:Sugar ABC transporter permease n=1 Tax=Methylobacterium oryzae TaxID=334852 RepID=A0ABU7TUB4_9HYPH
MIPLTVEVTRRKSPSRWGMVIVPLLTVVLAVASAAVMFSAYGASPGAVLFGFFVEPLSSAYNLGEVAIKAGPLILIAQGLAIGFRAKVWNVGAEGQLIVGAVAATVVPVYLPDSDSALLLPAMIVLAAAAGMLWAAIAALLRTRFNASEIIVTLMLTEIARQLLYYAVMGPLRDPGGFSFPQSVPFQDAALFPTFGETRANVSILICVAATVSAWIFVTRSFAGFRLLIGGVSPDAARYAGFSQTQAVWVSLLLGGAAAGLAGVGEIAGPLGKLQPILTPGYGYAAIIVAFLGALNPIAIVLAGLFMAVIYVGGDNALATGQIPASAPAVLQSLLLVYYLACAFFVNNDIRVGFVRRVGAQA